MKILINIGTNPSGGAAVHIIEIVNRCKFELFNIDKIVVLGPRVFLSKISDNDYIVKKSNFFLDGNFLLRFFWRFLFIHIYLFFYRFDLIFSPFGDFYSSRFSCLSMSQNMLMFEKSETVNFPFLYRLKFYLLGVFQIHVFKRSKNVIFLSNHAKEVVLNHRLQNKSDINYRVINHGISSSFFNKPRLSLDYSNYSKSDAFRILFVSNIFPYKNLDVVIDAFEELLIKFPNIQLDIIGEFYRYSDKIKYLKRSSDLMCNSKICFLGSIPHENISDYYFKSNLFIFSSSCENMPNILIEAMSSGIPIICSNKQPMPEFAKDSVLYYEPKSVSDLVEKFAILISNSELRKVLADKSYKYSFGYSWDKCSFETFMFIAEIVNKNSKK